MWQVETPFMRLNIFQGLHHWQFYVFIHITLIHTVTTGEKHKGQTAVASVSHRTEFFLEKRKGAGKANWDGPHRFQYQ